MLLSSSARPMTVAIDGPAAAGKSTVARRVASCLGLTYVDTGAMYRALTLRVLLDEVDPEDAGAVAETARRAGVSLEPAVPGSGAGQRVFLDGRDVSAEIRSRAVDRAVSPVSRHPEIRAWFREIQRRMAERGGVVMEGRDIGTAVLPGADVKVYLDASLDCRARRRHQELLDGGGSAPLEQVREDMARRDMIDSGRETDPLSVAEDAVRVDTTDMSLEEVVEEVIRLCRR